jgi:hypothetical protein
MWNSIFQSIGDEYELNPIVVYDDMRAKEYLIGPAAYVGGKYDPVGFFYNLYCNDLLDLVNEPGHILFLDDDDEIIPGAIAKLNLQPNQSYIVPFLRNDFQKPTPAQMFGHVLKEGYCGLPNMLLWSGHKQHVVFDDSELADYKVLQALIKTVPVKWLNIPVVTAGRRNRGLKEN